MADSSNAPIKVGIGADDSEFREKLRGLGATAKNALGGLAPVIAGYLGFRALSSGIKDVVQAFVTQEKAVMSVQAALRQQGGEWNRASKDLADFAGELQKLTIYGDEATMQVMAMGMNMGISRDQIKDATKAAMGLAAAYNMDLGGAMRLLGRAANGSTEMLSRYGIHVDKTKSKQEQFSEALRIGAKNFALAEAEADTLGGRITQMGNAWGDLKEYIGEAIAGIFGLKNGAHGLTDAFQEMGAWLNRNMADIIMYGRKGIKLFTGGLKVVYETVAPALEFIVSLVSAAVKNIMGLAEWLFDNASKLWMYQGEIIGGMLKDAWNAIKGFCKNLWDLLTGTVKGIWKAIRSGSMEGFSGLLDKFTSDLYATVADIGTETAKALDQAGITAMPSWDSPDYRALVDGYKNLGENIGRIADDTWAQLKQVDKEYGERLKRDDEAKYSPGAGREQGGGPQQSRKTDVIGSFSLRAFALMMGGGSPQQQTAQNTKRMLAEIRNVKQTLQSGINTTTELAYGE